MNQKEKLKCEKFFCLILFFPSLSVCSHFNRKYDNGCTLPLPTMKLNPCKSSSCKTNPQQYNNQVDVVAP